MASGETLAIFRPQCNEPPVANFAREDRRNTTSPHPVLDLALNEIAIFSFVVPRNYGGNGFTVYEHYAMTSAVANDIALETSFERIGDQQQDIDTDSFAGAISTTDIVVPGTSGLVDIISSVHTGGAQIDSLAVGEGGRLKIKRIAVAGSDAAGDLELRFVELKET